MNDPLPVAILQIVFIILAALCTGAESAVLSVNDYKMKEIAKDGNKAAKRVIRLMGCESSVIAAVQTARASFSVTATAIGVYLYTPWMEKLIGSVLWAFIAVVVIHIAVMVIVSEMIPRKICRSKSDESAMALSLFISFVWLFFRPVAFILNLFSKIFVAMSGNDPNGENAHVTEDEILMMVDLGSEKGTIAPEEKELIANIFEFGDLCADDIMTHRRDVTVLMKDETPTEWEEKIRESGYSRFPVCGEDIDDIVGVVYARELYELFYDKSDNVDDIIHQAYVVPEKMGLDVLFENMQKEKTHFAVVADEYGGFAGIVTMDDLLSEIVGEIEDEEYDEEVENELEDIISLEKNVWDMDGLTPLEEIAEITGCELPVDEFDTLSGLVLHSIDYIPDDGATIDVSACGLDIHVTEVKDRRIVRAIVKAVENDDEEENRKVK